MKQFVFELSSSTVKTETCNLSALAALSPAHTSPGCWLSSHSATKPEGHTGGRGQSHIAAGRSGTPGQASACSPAREFRSFVPARARRCHRWDGLRQLRRLVIIKLLGRVGNLASKVKQHTQNPQLLKVTNNYFGTSGRPWAGTAPGMRVQRWEVWHLFQFRVWKRGVM